MEYNGKNRRYFYMTSLQKLTPTPDATEAIIYLPGDGGFMSVELNVHVVNIYPNRLLQLPCTKGITNKDYLSGRCPICDKIPHSINLNNFLKERHDLGSLEESEQKIIKSYYAKYSPAPHATQYTYILLASILIVGGARSEPVLKIQRMSKTHLNNLAKQAGLGIKSLGGLECVFGYGIGHPSDVMREAIKTRKINNPPVHFKGDEVMGKLSDLWKEFSSGGRFMQLTEIFPEFSLSNSDSLEYLSNVDWDYGNVPIYGESPMDRLNRVHVYDPKVD
jgi:hypothetical protein